jgi:hypothetical protein
LNFEENRTVPTSYLYQINTIVELMVYSQPKSILDIGVGFGKYGFLAREYVGIRDTYDAWRIRVDGIEIHEGYITSLHDLIYDHLYIGDAREIVPSLDGGYDLVLLIDVIEHLEYEDGLALLLECRKRSRNLLVSTPKVMAQQGEVYGNPHEAHRFHWKYEHFGKFPDKFVVSNDLAFICFIGDDARETKKAIDKARRIRTIKKWLPFWR